MSTVAEPHRPKQSLAIHLMTEAVRLAVRTGFDLAHMDGSLQSRADRRCRGDVDRCARLITLWKCFDSDHTRYADDDTQLRAMLRRGGAGAEFLGVSIDEVLSGTEVHL